MGAVRHFGCFSINWKNFSLMLVKASSPGSAKPKYLCCTQASLSEGALIGPFNLKKEICPPKHVGFLFACFLNSIATIRVWSFFVCIIMDNSVLPFSRVTQLNFCSSAWCWRSYDCFCTGQQCCHLNYRIYGSVEGIQLKASIKLVCFFFFQNFQKKSVMSKRFKIPFPLGIQAYKNPHVFVCY